MVPPPPSALPKPASVPSAPTSLPGGTLPAKATSAGYASGNVAPTSLPAGSSGPGRPSAAPPPPASLPSGALPKPGVPSAPSVLPSAGGYSATSLSKAPAPPAPGALPGAGGVRPTAAPPPPRALPSVTARAGPSDSGFSAPPAPSGLPGAPARPTGVPKAPTAPSGVPAAPVRPGPPAAPSALPGSGVAADISKASIPSPAPVVTPVEVSPPVDEVPEDDAHDDSWKQYIEEDTEESDGGDSGDDSDEDVNAASKHGDRHKNDMDLLLKMQAKKSPKDRLQPCKTSPDAEAESANTVEETQDAATAAADEEDDDDEKDEVQSTTPSAAAGVQNSPTKQKGYLSRLFGSSKSPKSTSEIPPGHSMLGEDLSKHPNDWYESNLARLGKDGLRCTKVATNGKPYERFVYLDSRNLTLEIRGGRSGTAGVLMDDLVDIRQGLSSTDFAQFLSKLRNTQGLDTKALVLQLPHRTFSFLMPDRQQRDIVGWCILHLLKSKNRGVMATSDSTPSAASKQPSQGPKSGHGFVTYANKSSYEGQFQNYKRHGHGVLTLSDNTKYDANWKNDERHGEGKEFCPDGTTFEGLYVQGMRHGYGVMTWPEGSKYSGQFERGRANGEGELLRTDGSVYRGHFAEDCMSGDGRMQWRDGVEYVGQFFANKREGFGRMTWTSGRWQKYIGHWKDGMQHEAGTLVDHNGQEFKGYFKLGKLDYWIEE